MVDVTPQHQDPASSDDELAKVLAGIGGDDDHKATSSNTSGIDGLQFEETAPHTDATAPVTPPPAPEVAPGSEPVTLEAPAPTIPAPAPIETPSPTMPEAPAMPELGAVPTTGDGNLEGLKKTALEELRPLIGKLDLPAEEKFDTYLLIIRSTDDQSLLGPAHEAAKSINDEAKRAQALLDIIKEIDYFNNQQPAA